MEEEEKKEGKKRRIRAFGTNLHNLHPQATSDEEDGKNARGDHEVEHGYVVYTLTSKHDALSRVATSGAQRLGLRESRSRSSQVYSKLFSASFSCLSFPHFFLSSYPFLYISE